MWAQEKQSTMYLGLNLSFICLSFIVLMLKEITMSHEAIHLKQLPF